MSLLLYLAVLLVSVSSVLFGLGWLSAPEPRYEAPPAQVASHAPAKPAAAKGDARAGLSPVYTAAPGAPPADTGKPAVAASAQPQQPVAAAESVDAAGAEQADAAPSAEAAATPAPPACDIQACTRAYYSFRVSDCTYQPYEGPRRLCKKGTPPAKTAAASVPSDVDAQAQAAQAQASSCNVAACAAAYRTFDPTDCTYQPYEGPRRICRK